MTVQELIKALSKMPQDARVFHLWDGEPRTAINVVYETKNGKVMTADYEQVCYSDNAMPKDAFRTHIGAYWHTPKNPKGFTLEDDWNEI